MARSSRCGAESGVRTGVSSPQGATCVRPVARSRTSIAQPPAREARVDATGSARPFSNLGAGLSAACINRSGSIGPISTTSDTKPQNPTKCQNTMPARNPRTPKASASSQAATRARGDIRRVSSPLGPCDVNPASKGPARSPEFRSIVTLGISPFDGRSGKLRNRVWERSLWGAAGGAASARRHRAPEQAHLSTAGTWCARGSARALDDARLRQRRALRALPVLVRIGTGPR